jgi:hypothetical protein
LDDGFDQKNYQAMDFPHIINAIQERAYRNDLIRMPDLTEMVSLENQKRNCWRNSYTLDGTNFKGSGINVKAKRASSQMQSRVL